MPINQSRITMLEDHDTPSRQMKFQPMTVLADSRASLKGPDHPISMTSMIREVKDDALASRYYIMQSVESEVIDQPNQHQRPEGRRRTNSTYKHRPKHTYAG